MLSILRRHRPEELADEVARITLGGGGAARFALGIVVLVVLVLSQGQL